MFLIQTKQNETKKDNKVFLMDKKKTNTDSGTNEQSVKIKTKLTMKWKIRQR